MQYNITYNEKTSGIQVIISYKDNKGNCCQKSKQGFATKSEAKTAADKMVNTLKEIHSFWEADTSGANNKENT